MPNNKRLSMYYFAVYDGDQLVLLADTVKEFCEITGIDYDCARIALGNLIKNKQKTINVRKHFNCRVYFFKKVVSENEEN